MQTLIPGTRPAFNLAVAYATRKRMNKTEQSAKTALDSLCYVLFVNIKNLRDNNIKEFDYSKTIAETFDKMELRCESILKSDNLRKCDQIISQLFEDHHYLEGSLDHFDIKYGPIVLGELEGILLEMDDITEQFI